MTLTLAFSPCPNDCFIFDAIVHKRIDLEGLDFSVSLDDVEALNTSAFADAVRRYLVSAHYTPATIGGHPVRQVVQQKFMFNVN